MAIKTVSTYESALISLARFAVGRLSSSAATELLYREVKSEKVTKVCGALVEDTLRKGITAILAREGWRKEQFLIDNQSTPRKGRLWDRPAGCELAMKFSWRTMALLNQLASVDLRNVGRAAKGKSGIVTMEGDANMELGDRLVAVLLLEQMATLPDATRGMAALPGLAQDGLARLLCAMSFAALGSSVTDEVTFEPWLSPTGVSVLEALQRRLCQCWNRIEISKREFADLTALSTLANHQAATLTAFLHAIDQSGRRDLSRWLMMLGPSVVKLYEGSTSGAACFPKLDMKATRIQDRANLYKQALTVLGHFQSHLCQWNAAARNVMHYEPEYPASQLWKADWEKSGCLDIDQKVDVILNAVNPLT